MSRRISAVYSIPELPLSFGFHIFHVLHIFHFLLIPNSSLVSHFSFILRCLLIYSVTEYGYMPDFYE